MNKNLVKVLLAASALVSFSVQAEDYMAKTPYSAYVQDSSGLITQNATGLCWHTGYWTPADSVAGCDGEIAKAPTPVAAAPAPAPAPKPAPVAEKVTFAADAFFDFDKAVLKPEGKNKLNDLVAKLKNINTEVIIATGHTDSIGTDAYNQKLSLKRAAAVKAYLVSQGLKATSVYTEGKGEKQPVASNKNAQGRAKNRRVEIEVVGTVNR